MTEETKINFPEHIIQKTMDVVANISNYPDVPVLIIVRGLAGAGKSTYAKFLEVTFKTLQRKAMVIEADQYFYDAEGNYNFDATKLHKAHYWCQKSTAKNLVDGNIVIVANTFTTRSELNDYYEIAKEKHVPIVMFAMKNEFQNIHNVPEATLQKMKNRWVDVEREIVIDYSSEPPAPKADDSIVPKEHPNLTVLGGIDSNVKSIVIESKETPYSQNATDTN